MIFWCSVIVGVVFACMALKKNFYSTWAVLFNILIAVYTSIVLCPLVVALIWQQDVSRYNHAGVVFGIGVVVFAIMQTIAICFFTGSFKASFPIIFEKVGTAFLGFLCGWLICNFVFFVLYIMPFARSPRANFVFGPADSKPLAARSVIGVSNLVGKFSVQYRQNLTTQITDWLLTPQEITEDQKNATEDEGPIPILKRIKSELDDL